MKKIVSILLSAGAAVVITWFAAGERDARRYDQLSKFRAAQWQTEKGQLEAELAEAAAEAAPPRAHSDTEI